MQMRVAIQLLFVFLGESKQKNTTSLFRRSEKNLVGLSDRAPIAPFNPSNNQSLVAHAFAKFFTAASYTRFMPSRSEILGCQPRVLKT